MISRSASLRVFLALLALSSLLLLQECTLLAADSARPNIIMFLIDDQEKESIGAYGGKTRTPNLDRMAREGIRFNQAYVSSTVCTPSRYSFLTGRYPGLSTSKQYTEACGGEQTQGYPSFNLALEADRNNVGHVLKQAGYRTGFVGKFHLVSEVDFPQFFNGPDGLRPVPRRSGEIGEESTELFRHNERVMRRYIENLGFSWAKNIYPENMQRPYHQHNPEWTISAALEFIEQSRSEPFYLHICTTLLHGGEGSWRKSMDFPLISGEGQLKELPKVMTPRSKLLATLKENGLDPASPTAGEAWIDDAVGAVMNKLQALGLDKNTLVVFAPDHGRNAKSSLFSRSGTGVPLLMRWPAGIKAGTVCDELVQSVDLVPTFFEMARAKAPDGYILNGRSLLPLFDDGKAANWRDHLYFEVGCARAVTTKDWKYIAVRYTKEQVRQIKAAGPDRLPRLMAYIGRLGIGVRGADHPGFWDADQLYNLTDDPSEMKNLAAASEYADRLSTMKAMLTADIKNLNRPFGEFVPGGNTAPVGEVTAQIAQVKKIKIQGKRVMDDSE